MTALLEVDGRASPTTRRRAIESDDGAPPSSSCRSTTATMPNGRRQTVAQLREVIDSNPIPGTHDRRHRPGGVHRRSRRGLQRHRRAAARRRARGGVRHPRHRLPLAAAAGPRALHEPHGALRVGAHGVVARAGRHPRCSSGQTQGILFILVIGAATDYALLYVARFREALAHARAEVGRRRGRRCAARSSRSWPRAARSSPASCSCCERARVEPDPRPGRRDRHRVRGARRADLPAGAAALGRARRVLAAARGARGETAAHRRRDASAVPDASAADESELRRSRALGRRRPPRLAASATVWIVSVLVLGVMSLGLRAAQRRRRAVERVRARRVRGTRRPGAARRALPGRFRHPGRHHRSRGRPAGDGRRRARHRAASTPSSVHRGRLARGHRSGDRATASRPSGRPGTPAPEPTVVDGDVLLQATLDDAADSRRGRGDRRRHSATRSTRSAPRCSSAARPRRARHERHRRSATARSSSRSCSLVILRDPDAAAAVDPRAAAADPHASCSRSPPRSACRALVFDARVRLPGRRPCGAAVRVRVPRRARRRLQHLPDDAGARGVARARHAPGHPARARG